MEGELDETADGISDANVGSNECLYDGTVVGSLLGEDVGVLD